MYYWSALQRAAMAALVILALWALSQWAVAL